MEIGESRIKNLSGAEEDFFDDFSRILMISPNTLVVLLGGRNIRVDVTMYYRIFKEDY